MKLKMKIYLKIMNSKIHIIKSIILPVILCGYALLDDV